MARVAQSEIEFSFGCVVRIPGKRTPLSIVTYEDVKVLDVDEELGVAYVGGDRYSIHSGEIRRWRPLSSDANKIAEKKKAEGKK